MDDEKDTGSGKAGAAGKDTRPHITLDLKATEIRDERPADSAALPPPEVTAGDPRAAVEPPADHADSGANETGDDGGRARGSHTASAGAAAFILTHLAAGLVGGLIALIVAFYGVERFRDRMVAFSGTSAEEIKAETRETARRIALLEKSAAQPLAELSELKARLDAIAAERDEISARLSALGERVTKSEAQLGERAAAGAPSEADIAPLLGPLAQRLAALERKLAAVEEAQTSQKASVVATALAVAFGNLDRAVRSGRPFSTELDAVKALGAAGKDIAMLAAYQESGVEPIERLEKSLPDFIKAALDAEYAKEDSGFVGKLWANTRSMMNIRRKGLIEGDSTEAILARMETRLKAGDPAAAIREAESLKGEAAVILRPWLDKAKARAEASAALSRIEAGLLASLKPGDKTQ